MAVAVINLVLGLIFTVWMIVRVRRSLRDRKVTFSEISVDWSREENPRLYLWGLWLHLPLFLLGLLDTTIGLALLWS